MPSLVKPSVGRIVHYTPDDLLVCRAAIVTAVNEDGTIDAATFLPVEIYLRQNVEQDEVEHAGGTWHWPEQV